MVLHILNSLRIWIDGFTMIILFWPLVWLSIRRNWPGKGYNIPVKKDFKLDLDVIQPSQLFISSAKLASVIEEAPFDPLPVKELNGHVIFTDGHTRAYASYLKGLTEVDVYWDEDDLDWRAYQICVDWCIQSGIHRIADLASRIISADEYQIRWLRRCEEMHSELARKRREVGS